MLRPLRDDDDAAIAAVADDFMVARWMARGFPHPYTLRDARQWIALATNAKLARHFAIEFDAMLAGGIGVEPYEGEAHGSAAIGYWLGRAYWGRGIASDAVHALCAYAFGELGLRRLEARLFAENAASARVLEKSGFTLEGVLRGLYVDRAGKVCDALLFARLAARRSEGRDYS